MGLAARWHKAGGPTTAHRFRGSAALLAVTVVAVLFTTGAVAGDSRATVAAVDTPATAAFTVDGRVTTPLTLTVEELRRDYEGHNATSQFTKGCVTQNHRYRGALLSEVLTTAGPSFNSETASAKLSYAVLVSATDGYQAALSWGEIDPGYAGTRVLLAYEQDDVLLTRPHLIVPGDAKGGRYVCDVTNVSLLRLQR